MLRTRTILAFLLICTVSYLLVRIFSPYWAIIFLSLFFLFVGSALAWIAMEFEFEIKRKKMPPYPFVSVIVPNYNGAKTLLGCVQAVKSFSYPKNRMEIIVVDDKSTDESLSLLENVHGIRVLRQPKNKGKAAGINRALKVAKGELVACIDSDTYPAPDCLWKMASLFDSPKVGAVTGLIRVHKPKNLLMRIQEIEYLIGFGFYQSLMSVINAAYVTPGPMAMYKRKVLLDLGGYDEHNITEDMEIALRLQYNGYHIRAAHDANIYTEVPANYKGWFRQRLRWYRGAIMNKYKYREMIFNPKFGDLGVFSMPFTFMLEMSSVIVLFIVGVLIAESAYWTIQTILVWQSVQAWPAFEAPQILINSSAFFSYIILCAVFIFSLALAHKIAKERYPIARIVPTLSIIVYYSLAVSVVWLISLFKEINASDYRW